MRLGNADDAQAASEQIGTAAPVRGGPAHRHGGQFGQRHGGSSVHQHGRHGIVRPRCPGQPARAAGGAAGGAAAGPGGPPFAPRTAFGITARPASRRGTSDSVSLTEGINQGTAWGRQTARAVGYNRALAQTSQRSREFLVEQHELQQLPPSAVIVSYASPAGRRVVLADANPGILGLPTATLHSLDEALQAMREAAAAPRAGGGPGASRSPAAEDVPVARDQPAPLARPAPSQAGPVPSQAGPVPSQAGPVPSQAGPVPSQAGPAPSWAGPVLPPSRDPAAAPVSWPDATRPAPDLEPLPEPPPWPPDEG